MLREKTEALIKKVFIVFAEPGLSYFLQKGNRESKSKYFLPHELIIYYWTCGYFKLNMYCFMGVIPQINSWSIEHSNPHTIKKITILGVVGGQGINQ